MKPVVRVTLGLLAVVFYGVHAVYHVVHGRPENLLWACHLGTLGVGLGFLFRWPLALAVGFLWLSIGVPMWVLDLAMGGEFLPTSPLIHLGGPLLGVVGVKRLGLARGAWWKAVAALVPLVALCRWVTPPEENVNVAHAIWGGWEDTFPSHGVYLGFLGFLCAAVFLTVEFLLRRFGFRAPTRRRTDEP